MRPQPTTSIWFWRCRGLDRFQDPIPHRARTRRRDALKPEITPGIILLQRPFSGSSTFLVTVALAAGMNALPHRRVSYRHHTDKQNAPVHIARSWQQRASAKRSAARAALPKRTRHAEHLRLWAWRDALQRSGGATLAFSLALLTTGVASTRCSLTDIIASASCRDNAVAGGDSSTTPVALFAHQRAAARAAGATASPSYLLGGRRRRGKTSTRRVYTNNRLTGDRDIILPYHERSDNTYPPTCLSPLPAWRDVFHTAKLHAPPTRRAHRLPATSAPGAALLLYRHLAVYHGRGFVLSPQQPSIDAFSNRGGHAA